MAEDSGRRTIAIVGAGAAGTLTTLHLVRTSVRRGTELDLVVLDPADRWARGTAYGTVFNEHLLNVPAQGMSALPEDPAHFVRWRSRQSGVTEPFAFAPRRQYAHYLDDTLADTLQTARGQVAVRHERARVVGLRRRPAGIALTIADGRELSADAVVLAAGLPSVGHDWAPAGLVGSPFFVPDPWQPGALEVVRRDRVGPPGVLLVGAGLTAVDIVLTLTGPGNRSDRRVVAVSRHGRLPRAHRPEIALAAIPDISDWKQDLASLREQVARHVEGVRQAGGDWRPAIDGLRFRVSALWERLTEDEREEFLAHDAGDWNTLRHRMPPSSAHLVHELQAAGQLEVAAGEVASAEPLDGGGLRVTLTDGRCLEVGWVVNCTGPRLDVATLGDPLVDDLLRPRAGTALATLATAGMGFRTREGRLVDSAGSAAAPLWTLGALRRGELWESTAVPEIRSQASGLAVAVLDEVAPLPRRLADGRIVGGHHPVARPRDPLGLPISTTAEAAASYNAGLERVMRLQSGGEDLIAEAAALDPGFAVAHAALALLGHEAGAPVDVAAALRSAQEAARHRGDARERSLVEVVTRRVHDVRRSGAQALMAHLAEHPRDVLAVSAAVPTIAFSGVTDVQREAWDLVEGLAPAYGDHWWYISLLAFTRQDQGRFEEAGLLAESALSCEPSSGHAVHAQTHVLYETGRHEEGRVWLDHWVAESGRSASHRAHFSWHAALHELALGDTEAVRRRYYSQLAPPSVGGVRALVDSASLLWRWRLTVSEWFDDETAPPPVQPVLDAVDPCLLATPETPFVALHAALALAAAAQPERLVALRRHCRDSGDPVLATVVAPVCDALLASLEQRWDEAARTLCEMLPDLVRVGGSAAQREVVEETLLFCLVQSGQAEPAHALLDRRLDRRPSPLDQRRLASLGTVASLASPARSPLPV